MIFTTLRQRSIVLTLLLPMALVGCTKPDYAAVADLPIALDNDNGTTVIPAIDTHSPVTEPSPDQIAQQPLRDLTFTLVNNTSYTLREFYASPSADPDWGADILGRDVLPPGYRGQVTIADGQSTCAYDLRSVFSDGGELVRQNVDLCALHHGSYTLSEN